MIGAEWCVSAWLAGKQQFYAGGSGGLAYWKPDIEEAWLFGTPEEAEKLANSLGRVPEGLFEVLRADLVLKEKEARDGVGN